MASDLFHVILFMGIGYTIFWINLWFRKESKKSIQQESENKWRQYVQKRLDKLRRPRRIDLDEDSVYIGDDIISNIPSAHLLNSQFMPINRELE